MQDFIRLFLLFGLSFVGGSVPKISIGGWLERDVDSQWNYNSTPPLNTAPFSYSISVPSIIQGMILVCNASYPVEWRFHQERWNWRVNLQYAVKTTRISNGIDVVGFSSQLSFLSFQSNTLTGNYTCQKVGFPELSSSLYVFWEGTSPPYLTLASLYRKPPTIAFRKESGSFRLPCIVSVPTVVPRLSKEIAPQQEAPIPQNRSVLFDPRIGFTLLNLENPFGRYTCQVGDAEEEGDGDIITFNVIDDDDSSHDEFNDTLRHGAYYKIDSKNQELLCCSAGGKPPRLKLMECGHPTICAMAKHNLHSMESTKEKNGSCSIIKIRHLHAGVFRCVGAGIDVVREFFYPMPQYSFKRWGDKRSQINNNETSLEQDDPYYDWYEAYPAKMMRVTTLSSPLYVGETLNFTCEVSHFYYANGIVWAIVYTNQSIDYLDGKAIKTFEGKQKNQRMHSSGRGRHFEILFGKNQAFIEMTIVQNLDKVICYAPVWNSTEWGKKAIDMEVRHPIAPVILGKNHEEITWYLNDTDKTLECIFEGEPAPNVTWTKGTITVDQSVQSGNGTSKINIPRVSVGTQEIYVCRVYNVAGSVSKTFDVTVLHAATSALKIVSIMFIVILLCVFSAIVFACRYLKSQKSIMQHLANLAFKDVSSTQSSRNGAERRQNPVSTVHGNANGSDNPTIDTSTVGSSPSSWENNIEGNMGENGIGSAKIEFGQNGLSSDAPKNEDPGSPNGYEKLREPY